MTNIRKLENKSDIFRYLIALFFMAIPLDYVLPHFGNATILFVLGIVISLFAIWLVLSSRQAFIAKDQLFIIILIFVTFVSIAWAEDIGKAMSYAFSFIATSAMYFLLLFFKFKREEVLLFEKASIIGGMGLVLYVFTQVDMDLVMAGYRLDFNSIGAQDFSDPNGLAARLMMPTVFLIKYIFESKKLPIKLLCGVGLASILYVVLLTGSRASIISLFSIAFVILFHNIKGKYVGTIFIGVFLLIVAFLYLPEILPEHIYERIFSAEKYQEVTSLEGDRIDIWKNVLFGLFPKSPIWGYGAGNSSIVLIEYYGRIKAVHNSWLVVLADLGLLGFVPWMLLAFGKLKQAWKLRKKSIYVLAVLIGIIIMATTLDGAMEKYLWNGFFYVHLVATMYTLPDKKENEKI